MNQKKYAGNPPGVDEGWSQVGQCAADGVEWCVYAKPQDHSDEWITYKIVANGRAVTKANYWMAKNSKTGQIGFARDYYLLRTNRPKLFEQVDGMING